MMIDMDPDDAAFHPPTCTCCLCAARRERTERRPIIPFDFVQEDDGDPQ